MMNHAFCVHEADGLDCQCREVARLRARVDELLTANNAEVAKRRGFEDDACQQHAELALLRSHMIELRIRQQTLAAFIEDSHANADEPVPEEVAAAMEPFPGGVYSDTELIEAVIRNCAEIEQQLCGTWRVSAYCDYEDTDLRKALAKLIDGEGK